MLPRSPRLLPRFAHHRRASLAALDLVVQLGAALGAAALLEQQHKLRAGAGFHDASSLP